MMPNHIDRARDRIQALRICIHLGDGGHFIGRFGQSGPTHDDRTAGRRGLIDSPQPQLRRGRDAHGTPEATRKQAPGNGIQPTGGHHNEFLVTSSDRGQQNVVESLRRIVDHIPGSSPRGAAAARPRQPAKSEPHLIERHDGLCGRCKIMTLRPASVNRHGNEPIANCVVFDEALLAEDVHDGGDVNLGAGGVGPEQPPGAAANGAFEPLPVLLQIAGVAR